MFYSNLNTLQSKNYNRLELNSCVFEESDEVHISIVIADMENVTPYMIQIWTFEILN